MIGEVTAVIGECIMIILVYRDSRWDNEMGQ